VSSSQSFLRFQNRAAAYADSRPNYPVALLDHVFARLALGPGAEVADIGSGTGIFTRALLERGLRVAAVEPSDNMRRTG
jgi:cyclopropane fatty-acyl-phospholipid synthase-like methyltransferase